MGPLVAAFERLTRDHPDREALWSRGEQLRLTYHQLAERAASWEPLLAGDRRPLALALGNVSAFVELFVAARRLGIPVALMEAGGSAAERIALCRQLGLPRLIHHPGPEAASPQVAAGLPSRPLARGIVETLPSLGRGVVLPRGTEVIKLTSGSTGRPLAACFTEECLEVGVRQIGEGMEITPDDRVVLAIPLSHSYGFDNGVLSAMVLGTPLVLEPSIFPGDL
ncbi:MAG: acyl--CoA ligase, partial [Holophagales bacterium]|nr:acyl--CoA ligase [Holophagales bacterium]